MVNFDNSVEIEQEVAALTRERILGIHVAPVKKARKCVNKKSRTYSRNVVIKMNPDSKAFKEKMAEIRSRITV
jgi:hypothetical protein